MFVIASNYIVDLHQYRERYQGIVPPVNRSEEYMDACAKYHVAANVPYIRYFVSYILQFQFYREMCLEAKQYVPESADKPLHRCDFSEGDFKDAAGEKLRCDNFSFFYCK